MKWDTVFIHRYRVHSCDIRNSCQNTLPIFFPHAQYINTHIAFPPHTPSHSCFRHPLPCCELIHNSLLHLHTHNFFSSICRHAFHICSPFSYTFTHTFLSTFFDLSPTFFTPSPFLPQRKVEAVQLSILEFETTVKVQFNE